MPELLPLFLKLDGRRVLVVGGGSVALGRVRQLAAAGAEVVVVAPEVQPEIPALAAAVHLRPFAPGDLDGAWLVIAAATPPVNREVARLAEARRLFVNAIDDPASASAYAASVIRRDGITVAVSTEGRAPALAGLLREAIEALLPDDAGIWVARAEALRKDWRESKVPMARRRRLLLDALDALYRKEKDA